MEVPQTNVAELEGAVVLPCKAALVEWQPHLVLAFRLQLLCLANPELGLGGVGQVGEGRGSEGILAGGLYESGGKLDGTFGWCGACRVWQSCLSQVQKGLSFLTTVSAGQSVRGISGWVGLECVLSYL